MASSDTLVLTSLLRRMDVEPLSTQGAHCAILTLSIDGCDGNQVSMPLTPYQASVLSARLKILADTHLHKEIPNERH